MVKYDKKTEFTINHARRLFKAAQKTHEELFTQLKSSYKGLSEPEVKERLRLFGINNSIENKNKSVFKLLLRGVRNPINYLVIGLAVVSYFTGNKQASVLMLAVVFISILLTFIQEFRFNLLVKKLLSLTQIKITVIRNYPSKSLNMKAQLNSDHGEHEIPIAELVPGDIVRISTGDIVPADMRLLSSKNLLVNQSVLTGETVPVEKDSEFDDALLKDLPDLKNVCFLGSYVVSGAALGIVIHTGHEAYVSSLAKQLKPKNETSFESGTHNFVMRILKFMLILIPLVFVISLISKGSWEESFLFAITITVSLTPKSLPLTITGNLGRSALAMMKKKVIVKHLTAIQNLGAIDILCTDKTGALTEDLSLCGGAFNQFNKPDKDVLLYAYLNSFFRVNHKNHLDFALIKHCEDLSLQDELKKYFFRDEIPFDSERKRASILLRKEDGSQLLICKGAIEEILPLCMASNNETTGVHEEEKKNAAYISIAQKMNELDQQAIAVAIKTIPADQKECQLSDEENLNLLGYVTFQEPPLKSDVVHLFKKLNDHGVQIKLLTGSNHWDVIRVASKVGLKHNKILLGNQIDAMSDHDLQIACEKINLFAKLSPDHKQRIVHALQDSGHTVGYLGDGINDVPGLFASDVSISVHNAVSSARESSDIILLEKDLAILIEGIIDGRKSFINISRYIKISSVTKFGTAITMLGASIFLPFAPLLPLQMIVQNLIFGFSQWGLPFDKVDEDELRKPSKWEFGEMQKYRFSFGLTLSFFDFVLFALMWFYFSTKTFQTQGLFQSAWLVESVIAQIFIIHIFHSKKTPLFAPGMIKPSYISSFCAIVLCLFLPFSSIANWLEFQPLPKEYFLWMIGIIIVYAVVIELIKKIFTTKYEYKN